MIAAPDTGGQWQYSLDDGANWSAVDNVSFDAALLLGPSAIVRFVPDAGLAGRITDGFRFHAWDQSSGTSGGLALRARFGGTSPFSTDSARVELLVQEANQAPTALCNLTTLPGYPCHALNFQIRRP